MEHKNDKIKDNISENTTDFANWWSNVLLSYKSKLKATVVYSIADVFVIGLCVTSIVPIVHAPLMV